MKQLQTGRPRPVALEIPSDVLAQSSDVDLMSEKFSPSKHRRRTP